MKKLTFGLLGLVTSAALGVSMNFTGTFRSEASSFSHLSQPNNTESTQFISARGLLEPNVLVDDHFSIRSQWNLLTSSKLTPDATEAMGLGQGGYVFGDTQTSSLTMSRAWLEWTSDFGVVRIGRMPISWGYGLIWDAGSRIWDDYQTTQDRLEYRLHLGNVIGALAYSKPRKASVLESDNNDQDFYTAYLQYDSAEMDVEGGILFEKQVRTPAQATALTTGTGKLFKVPSGYTKPYPLASAAPHPKSNNILDIYLKKTTGYFTLGAEVGWLSGTSFDTAGDEKNLNAFGAVANVTFEYHDIKSFLEVLYASGDNDLSDTLRGFVMVHPNRVRPGIILGQELIGSYHANAIDHGRLDIYGNTNSYSGVLFFRPGFRVDWSPAWASGIEFIYAKKAATQGGEDASLGFEVDLGTDYNVYKNFDLGLNLGFAFPGKGMPTATGEHKMIFGLRTTAVLKF